MKYIKKNSPPQSLIAFRNKPNATYAKLTRSRKIYKETKQSLCEEQGYICCYCGRRINCDEQTQIEHFFAKGTPEYDDLQLDYETNLLACCDGGKSKRQTKEIDKSQLFCEAVKGNRTITINPLTIECECKFLFSEDGDILGVGKDAEVTIKMLNLNSPILKNMRKKAIDSLEKYCPNFTTADWEKEMARLAHKIDGKFEEFCFVLQSYILFFKLGQ